MSNFVEKTESMAEEVFGIRKDRGRFSTRLTEPLWPCSYFAPIAVQEEKQENGASQYGNCIVSDNMDLAGDHVGDMSGDRPTAEMGEKISAIAIPQVPPISQKGAGAMHKITLTDSPKWFDADASTKFEEATWWNGSNHISKATGSQKNKISLLPIDVGFDLRITQNPVKLSSDIEGVKYLDEHGEPQEAQGSFKDIVRSLTRAGYIVKVR